MRLVSWYWLLIKKLPHFVKEVWEVWYCDKAQKYTYVNKGPMVVDDFGELVLAPFYRGAA